MSGCLSVCANAAKTLAAALQKPLVGVHHMVRSFIFIVASCSEIVLLVGSKHMP